jgi:hypothetical protein
MKKVLLILMLILLTGCSKTINKENIRYVELSSVGQQISNVDIKIFDNRSYVYEIRINYPANIVASRNGVISNSEFDILTELIVKSDFFNLKDEYKSDGKNAYILTVKTDRYSKSITFYENSDAPQELLNVAGFIHKIIEERD